jgi:3-phytase
MQKYAIALLLACTLSACAAARHPNAANIAAVRETAPVSATGDAADDPAIWVAPEANQSLVIATQKQGGLYVFDLAGAIVQEVPGGRPNNVDLRPGFAWAEGPAPIVGASDRTDNSIALWRFDPETRQLEAQPRARIPTGFVEVYGFCLGRMGEDFVAIASDKGGEIGAWRLRADGQGAIAAERFVTFSLGSITEGCVVDDETGDYYLGDELNGIWRVALSDAGGAGRRLIDTAGAGGHLTADVEGLSLWLGEGGAGYLVASAQGGSAFVVYDRVTNEFLGDFRIAASLDGAADAVSGTDGIDIVSAPLGPDFPRGLMVAQDDENTDPAALQNFKYVSWADVEAALGLPR